MAEYFDYRSRILAGDIPGQIEACTENKRVIRYAEPGSNLIHRGRGRRKQ